MQKIVNHMACILLLSLLLIPAVQPKAMAQDVVVSYQDFYDQLAPYGQWVSDPQYGNVWVPNEEPGYRPYATRGNWVMTDQGNMWVSDVPWGWACYHYGRWTYNPYYGWVWIPGQEWAPAWVNWRSGGGYYGWAPMGPGQYPGSYYEYPVNYWVFVSPQYLYHPNVYGYYQPSYSETYYHQTTYINETYVVNGSSRTYYYGPRASVIERETNQPIQVYHVSNSNAPGAVVMGGSSVSIYRPAINANSVNTARPANVITASQPIGKPQAIVSVAPGSQPAFHQEMQRQNPAFARPNNYSNPTPAQRAVQQNNQNVNQNQQSRPANNHFGSRPAQQTPEMEQHTQPNTAEHQNNHNQSQTEMTHSQPQTSEVNHDQSQNTETNRGQSQNYQQNSQQNNRTSRQPRQAKPAPQEKKK